MNEIASRYANALYSLALESHKVNEWQIELRLINKLFNENKEFLNILSSAFISLKEKEEIIDNSLKNIDSNIVNLIKLMVKNHREKYLLDTFHAYNSLANESRGVKEGLIYSTKKLDEDLINVVNKKIGEIEHREVELYNIIDPTLIGGIRVVIDGHIYDGSIRTHLLKLKESLLK